MFTGFLALGIEAPQLLARLNVMGGFFLVFDISMDISNGNFISGKADQTHHNNFLQ